MDYEPAFAPHPSYQLEDSSDESDWDEDATSKIKSKDELAREPRVHLEGRTDALVKGRTVVYLVGEAGERMAQAVKVESDQQLIQIHVEAQQVGAILPDADGSGTTIVFLTNAIQLDSLNPLAQFLVETLAPSSSTIIASYHLASYIAPPAFTSRLPILFLAPTPPSSRADSAIDSLRTDETIEPFSTPNLLHGLASSLVIVSSVASPESNLILFLLPTSSRPTPLNGPFSNTSPITTTRAGAIDAPGSSLYDAGGPIGLYSDPSAQFRFLCRDKLGRIKRALAWDWWNPDKGEAGSSGPGKGFEWLEQSRKSRKKREVSSMFM
ncbi:hypothetical protein JCM3766R1_006153 [Sporobolomyces carnicolor]